MTKDEIIRMAREAGFDSDYFDNVECSCDECNFLKKPLERFATLVADHEREACANLCDEWYEKRGLYGVDFLAKAIRARGEK